MDKKQAHTIIDRFSRDDNPSKDSEFAFIEACSFLIDTENDTDAMTNLGGYYYGLTKYDLAEKYYLMADENGDDWAADGLGYIYYYGRVGAPDYKKAFHYFSKAKDHGNLEAAMKIADMYHNGYGVDKDDKKYKEILDDIYGKVKDTNKLGDPLPEVSHRLAAILIDEGKNEEASLLLLNAKPFIAERIRFNPFWGNFIVCRRIVQLLYQTIPFDEKKHFDFYDLFYFLLNPKKVRLTYEGKNHTIESLFDEGAMRVKCDEKYYKSVEDFLLNATFEGKHTYVIDYEDYYKLREEK